MCIMLFRLTCLAALDQVGAAAAADVDLRASGPLSNMEQSSPTSEQYTLSDLMSALVGVDVRRANAVWPDMRLKACKTLWAWHVYDLSANS